MIGLLKFAVIVWLCLWAGLPAFGQETRVPDAQVTLATNVTIPAATSGIVRHLAVNEGQPIRVDDVIAELDDRQANAEYESVFQKLNVALLESENDVDLRYAQMSLEVHQKEYDQSRQANASFAGSVSQSELRKQQLVVQQSRLRIEQAERDAEIARAKVAEHRAAATAAQVAIDQHQVRSPVSGVIAQRMVNQGEWVAAGEPVARVIGLDRLRIECFIDPQATATLVAGQRVRFTSASLKESVYHGTIRFIAPEFHPVTGQARLWAEVDNHDGQLRPGMQGTLIVGSAPAAP